MAARNSRGGPPFGLDRLRLQALWERLWSNYWFVPGMMTVVAGLLAVVVGAVDQRWIEPGPGMSRLLYGASAAGARAVLSTIAGSMITVAGVSFSVVLVALSQTASMFGPRLLPNFMRDRGNQVALGTFVATFVYSVTLLMQVRGEAEEGSSFVPRLGVFVALLLALGSVAVLIFFLHHAATSIQAGHIVRMAGRRLDEALETVYPPAGEGVEEAAEEAPELAAPRATVLATASGYVEAVDHPALVRWAEDADMDVLLFVRPGDHVARGDRLAEVGPAAAIDDALADAVRAEIVLARDREGSRDVRYRVDQLVEVAVRALSPGINDPLTAVHAVHRLGESLAAMLERSPAPAVHRDEAGRVRVVPRVLGRDEVLNRAFTLIRHYGSHDPLVPLALLDSLRRLAARAPGAALRAAILEVAREILEAAREGLRVEADRARVEARFREVAEKAAGASAAGASRPRSR